MHQEGHSVASLREYDPIKMTLTATLHGNWQEKLFDLLRTDFSTGKPCIHELMCYEDK